MSKRSTPLSILLGFFAAPAAADTFATPQDAVAALEKAYADGDIESAIGARNFDEEARRMLQRIDPKMAADPSLVRETAKVLELGYRNESSKTFRKWKGVTCAVDRVEYLEETLALVTETCVSNGKSMPPEKVHVAKTDLGWRVVSVPE